MPADSANRFQSLLSACMEKFLLEKHACGYAYREQTRILRHLDNFLVQEGLATYELPGSIARKWLAKKPTKVRKPASYGSASLDNSPAFCCGLAIRHMC